MRVIVKAVCDRCGAEVDTKVVDALAGPTNSWDGDRLRPSLVVGEVENVRGVLVSRELSRDFLICDSCATELDAMRERHDEELGDFLSGRRGNARLTSQGGCGRGGIDMNGGW